MKQHTSARPFGVLAATTALVVSMTGCSAYFPADVTSTASVSSPQPVACSPQDAQLTWHPLQDAELGALGYRTLNVAPDGMQDHVDTEFDYAPTVTSDELLAPAYFEPPWLDFLMGEFGRTGQVGAFTGELSDFFDSAKPSDPQIGVYIMGFQTGQVSVPFDLTCAGEEVGSGLLTTSASPLMSSMVFCGEESGEESGEETSASAIDEDFLVQLRSYCPAS
ncbi:hypothetical protein [Cryobacterium sp. Y50]|uniref:hypothetical protein n=1 Tax=Cryobacterium sp. Y50 TaxID=2048286 RepID=UPI000CE4AF47|nr:hypothetical protein [Cryobacterium sp. Y50]